MSSFKNASKSFQKTHRERHQPEARQHLGNLEKRKDYRDRADDYNAKKAQMQYLHKKALDKNPDEFYYHMINADMKDGIHHDKAKDLEFTEDQVKLMMNQDKRYIASRHVMEVRKVERLKASLHRLEETPLNKHTFFVDDDKEVKKFSLAKRLDTDPLLLSRRYNRPRTSNLSDLVLPTLDPETVKACIKMRGKGYKELLRREGRREKLRNLEKKMEIKKVLQSKKKTIKQRIAPETKEAPPTYVFKQERHK